MVQLQYYLPNLSSRHPSLGTRGSFCFSKSYLYHLDKSGILAPLYSAAFRVELREAQSENTRQCGLRMTAARLQSVRERTATPRLALESKPHPARPCTKSRLTSTSIALERSQRYLDGQRLCITHTTRMLPALIQNCSKPVRAYGCLSNQDSLCKPDQKGTNIDCFYTRKSVVEGK